jgi:hypothetical protein
MKLSFCSRPPAAWRRSGRSALPVSPRFLLKFQIPASAHRRASSARLALESGRASRRCSDGRCAGQAEVSSYARIGVL